MFNVGDKIVYPMHGAGVIDAIEEKDILGEKQSYYILKSFCQWSNRFGKKNKFSEYIYIR